MVANAAHPPISLEDVLAYRHDGVMRRYVQEHQASPEEAAEVFQEMLKYLYLSYRAATSEPENFGCVVSDEIEKIDWMWHMFLLFTIDYAEFCDCYFGFFLHHVPNEAEVGDPSVDASAVLAQVERQVEFVYDMLGEKTLTAWYDECRYSASA
jgi:hypothetical protein